MTRPRTTPPAVTQRPPRALSRTATSHLGLRVPDVEAATQFYERILGLRVHAPLEDGGMRLGWGQGHHVLDLLPGPKTLDHFAFEILGERELDAFRKAVESSGAESHELYEHAAEASGFRTVDPDGNIIHFHGGVDRSGEVGDPGAHRPIRFQHITLSTTDVAAMLEFYTRVIGFRQSDVMGENEFAWLRSNREHHTLALAGSDHGGDIDHYAFDITGWAELKVWCDRLTEEGVDITWGPGRHGPGNNLFIFFDDPAGNQIELSAELERFHDDRVEYPVRRWEAIPGTPNLWGGQLPHFRKTSKGA
jgi:catechol 2,3-dioxygenase